MPLAMQYSATPLSSGVVPDAQLDLHGGDLGDASGLLDLSDVDVAEADVLDQAVALQRGERAHAGRERRSRIGRVKLIQIDAVDAERAPARLARGDEVAGAAVGDPAPCGRVRPPLVATRMRERSPVQVGERARDQPLVVAGIVGIPAVGVGGVEEGDAGIEARRAARRSRAPRRDRARWTGACSPCRS